MILDFDYITMGQRIKQRRKELNMTQADFAEKLVKEINDELKNKIKREEKKSVCSYVTDTGIR